jgi:hypothetical protein
MFLQKFDILINKQGSPITNFNDEVTKLPASDEITRIDGSGVTHTIALIKLLTKQTKVFPVVTVL